MPFLEKLLAAWGRAPSAELVELVGMASALERTHPPGLRGKTKAARAAWDAVAKRRTAADVPALLEALPDVLWRDAYHRVRAVRTWPADPRVDEAMVALLEALPYRSTSKPFYVEVIALAGRICDPALVARVERARASIADVMSPTLGDWLARRVDELLEELRPRRWKTQKAAPELKAVRAALVAETRQAAPRAELAELLAAIYERPDDLARRLVYADALLERGDVRGELITLQCQDTLTPAQRRRERALIKAHGIAWLGELAPIVRKGFELERGFLAACTVDSNKGARIRPLVGHPAWSTVHTLADSAQIALHPVMRSLRTLEFRPNRAYQREGLDEAWRELLAGTARPIERLHFTDLDNYADRDEQIAMLARCEALPRLRELHVGGLAIGYLEQLLHAPIARRLAALGFTYDLYDEVEPGPLRAALRDAVVPAVVIRHAEMTARIERGTSGYERVTIEQHARTTFQACLLLGALPPSVRELSVVTAPETDRGALVALASAARALPALEVRRIGPA